MLEVKRHPKCNLFFMQQGKSFIHKDKLMMALFKLDHILIYFASDFLNNIKIYERTNFETVKSYLQLAFSNGKVVKPGNTTVCTHKRIYLNVNQAGNYKQSIVISLTPVEEFKTDIEHMCIFINFQCAS